MKLVEFVPPVKHPLWKLCLQMGITDVIVKVNPTLTGLPDPWKFETLKKIVDGLKAEGLTVVGLEGDPFDMSPIKEYGARGGERINVGERTLLSVRNKEGECSANERTGVCVLPQRTGVCVLPQRTGVCVLPQRTGVCVLPQRTGVCVLPQRTGVCVLPDSQDEAREEALAHYRELLESMAKLGIKLLCYNFMVGPGWSRTGVRPVRGGALATYFSLAETSENGHSCPFGRTDERTGVSVLRGKADERTGVSVLRGKADERTGVSVLRLDKSQVWANYEYFIKAVMPTAEKVGVRMGLHPDDPCLPSLGGYARIFETVADYDRAYALYPSPSNAVTYCQANFKLMLTPPGERTLLSVRADEGTDKSVRSPWEGVGTDKSVRSPWDATSRLIETARHFGKRIAFIHVRDVEGDKTDFTELFHDQGTTDQFALMRTYRELGLDVPVRGDHVPEMEGDRKLVEDAIPGYFNMGRLFANGYLKALLKGTEKGGTNE